jgi:hypothetical protein
VEVDTSVSEEQMLPSSGLEWVWWGLGSKSPPRGLKWPPLHICPYKLTIRSPNSLLSWRWRHYVPSKHWYLYSRLCSVTTQKTTTTFYCCVASTSRKVAHTALRHSGRAGIVLASNKDAAYRWFVLLACREVCMLNGSSDMWPAVYVVLLFL